ncbi:MAG: SDR family oxidoreductase [Bacteriovoracaceae bacterium]|nr:SDR family oxidoreductase [Bacteriovoracaceae bacterium]
MQNKIVIITGSSGLIGKALVQAFSGEGASVIGLDKASPSVLPSNCEYIPCDLEKPEEILRACESIKKVDVLINNAGISNPTNSQIGTVKLQHWNKMLNTNLSAAFTLSNFLAKKLRDSKGSIVNISSTRSLMSEPNNEAYAACKGALNSLTHALMNSFAPDVNVNCISPGWITSDEVSDSANNQHPSGRVGAPEDVANLCLFLVSEKARFINGQNIVIDGGMTKKMIYVD